MEYYFCSDSRTVEGPFSAPDLANLRHANRIGDDTQIAQAGSENWRAYKDEFPDGGKPFDMDRLFAAPPSPFDRVEPPPLWQPAPIPQSVTPSKSAASSPEITTSLAVPGRPASEPSDGAAPGRSARPPWYKRTGWSIVLFYFFSPIMFPLMWYWKLYSLRTRILVSVGFGALFVLVVVVGLQEDASIRQEFAAKRVQILAEVRKAAEAHDYRRVVALGEKYEIVHDPELDGYRSTAQAGLQAAEEKRKADQKAAEEKEKAAKSAAEPVTDWSHRTKAEWKEKAARNFNWNPLTPLYAPAPQFQALMGEPKHSGTRGNVTIWIYQCSDGFIELKMDASILQTMGAMQAEIRDY